MTDLAYVPSLAAASGTSRRVPWIVVLYTAGLGAGAIGAIAAIRAGGAASSIEWQLALLMRFMAVVKGAMVLGTFGLTHWRLRQPAGDGLAFGYVASLALMALAPGLIWSMAHIVLGAACFHAGLLLFLVLAWRDGAVSLPNRRA